MRNLWTNIVFYAATIFRGDLRFCERCGKLTECFLLGEQTRLHWRAVGLPEDACEVPELFDNMRLCIVCDSILSEQLELHAECCGMSQYSEGRPV